MALNKDRNRCEVVSDLQVCAKSLFLIKRWQLCMSGTFITYREVLTMWIVCCALSSWGHVGAVVTSLLEGPGFEPVFLWGVCSHILHNILTYLNMPTEQTNDAVITIKFNFSNIPVFFSFRLQTDSAFEKISPTWSWFMYIAAPRFFFKLQSHAPTQDTSAQALCTLSAPKRMRNSSHKIEDNKTEATDQRTYDRVTILCWDHCSLSVGVLGCGVYTAVSFCKKHSCSCF